MVRFEEYLTEEMDAKERLRMKREIMRKAGTIWTPSSKFFKNFRTAITNLSDDELHAVWSFAQHIRNIGGAGGLNSPK
jgi:hypothetical protein